MRFMSRWCRAAGFGVRVGVVTAEGVGVGERMGGFGKGKLCFMVELFFLGMVGFGKKAVEY